MSHAQLAAAIVMLREDSPGAKRLVAYYVEDPQRPSRSVDELVSILGEHLPEYMIPSTWVQLPKLPISPNGKLDRKALPVPDATHGVQQEFVAPTTPTEIALTKIFAEVLHLDSVGVTADLLRLGADSIQLFQITARANRAGIRIDTRQLLQHRTAALLAALVDSLPSTPPVATVEKFTPRLERLSAQPTRGLHRQAMMSRPDKILGDGKDPATGPAQEPPVEEDGQCRRAYGLSLFGRPGTVLAARSVGSG